MGNYWRYSVAGLEVDEMTDFFIIWAKIGFVIAYVLVMAATILTVGYPFEMSWKIRAIVGALGFLMFSGGAAFVIHTAGGHP